MVFGLSCLVIGTFINGIILIAMYNMQFKRLDIIRDRLDKSNLKVDKLVNIQDEWFFKTYRQK